MHAYLVNGGMAEAELHSLQWRVLVLVRVIQKKKPVQEGDFSDLE